MKVLVTGGSCLLGRYLSQVLGGAYTWNTVMQDWTDYHLDITDESNVRYIFSKIKPTHVIHLAAVGDVDWVENNYLEATKINLDGLDYVLSAAEDYKSKIIYTSSNAVFSGDNPPYEPDSERRPINAYGKMRKAAENRVMRYKYGYAIARLFLLYGWQPKGARQNWASRLVGMLNRGETPRLVSDRHWQPTYAGDAAKALVKLLGKEGIWHVMGKDRVTLYEFGGVVADTFGFDSEKVLPILSDDLPGGIAPRPVDSSYDPVAERTMILPGINRGLVSMIQEHCDYICGIERSGWVPEAGCPVHDV